MAEYSDNRQTRGIASTLGTDKTPADVVRGWWNRYKENNSTALSSLVPFVQLIGLYNREELTKLTNTEVSNRGERTAIFVNEDWSTSIGDIEYDPDDAESPVRRLIDEQIEYLDEKIRSKYIGLTINGYSQSIDGEGETIPGIVLATNQSQVGELAYENYVYSGLPKDSGGVGITDFQMETGTKEFSNRRFKVRITVTDPQVLNDQAEYLKLSSLQSTFLLIYGWSNPNAIVDWEGAPPPHIHSIGVDDLYPAGKMTVDVTEANTGGLWSAAVVHTTKFDFAFNEIGQLEATFTFMPRIMSFLATYRVPVVSDNMRLFLGTGEQSSGVDPETGTQVPRRFAGLASGIFSAATEFGGNLTDIIYEEQRRLQDSSYKGDEIGNLFDLLDIDLNLSDTLLNFQEKISEWGDVLGGADLFSKQKEEEAGHRFPFAGPGIRQYTEKRVEWIDPLLPGGTGSGTEKTSTIIYYYLGWILEAMRFSLWDLNKNKVLNGQKPFDLRFKYAPVPSDSHFTLAFQDVLGIATPAGVDPIIAYAIAKFQKDCTPDWRYWHPESAETNIWDTSANVDGTGPDAAQKVMDQNLVLGAYDGTGRRRAALEEPVTITEAELIELNNNFYHDNYMVMGSIDINNIIVIGSDGPGETPMWRGSRNAYEGLTYSEKLSFIPDAAHSDAVLVPLPPSFQDIDANEGREWTDEEAEAYTAAVRANIAAVEAAALIYQSADYRKSLVVDNSDIDHPGLLRIMHPEFEGQLLYNFKWKGDLGVEHYRSEHWEVHQKGLYSTRTWGIYGDGVGGNITYTGKHGFVWSKIKKFFFGEITKKTLLVGDAPHADNLRMFSTQKFGLICPAVSARYFAPGRYEACQHKWYNKHFRFLNKYFSSLISNTLKDAYVAGNIDSVKNQAVDLFWLTGRKYEHPYHKLINNGVWIPEYDTAGLHHYNWLSEWSHDEVIEKGKLNMITGKTGGETIADLEQDREKEQGKVNIFNNILNGNGDDIGQDRVYVGNMNVLKNIGSMRWDYGSGLGYNIGTFVRVEDAIVPRIKTKEGLHGLQRFWNRRINAVLTDLYNKDIIEFPDARAADLSHIGPHREIPLEKTLASENSIENKISDRINNLEWQAEQYGAPQAILLDQAEVLGNYINSLVETGSGTDYALDRKNRYIISYSDTKQYAPLSSYESSGYEVLWFEILDPSDEIRGSGAVVQLTDEDVNGIGLDQLLANPDKFIRCISPKYTNSFITLDLNNVSSIGELKLDYNNPGLDYIFMNYVDDSMRNEFANGKEMYEAATSGSDDGVRSRMEEGYEYYMGHIEKRRELLRRYLEKLQEVNELMVVPQSKLDLAQNEISIINDKKVSMSHFDALLDDPLSQTGAAAHPEIFSPFAPAHPHDKLNVLNIGGGRPLALDGIVAQYWAARFSKRIIWGATDVRNYKPKANGSTVAEFVDSDQYSWDKYMAHSGISSVGESRGRISREHGQSDYTKWADANLGDGNQPYKILDVNALAAAESYTWNGEEYAVKGIRGDSDSWVNDQPNALLWHGATYGNMFYSPLNDQNIAPEDLDAHSIPRLKVEHLARSGFVNIDLIKEIALETYELPSIGFTDDVDMLVKIVGHWPFWVVGNTNWFEGYGSLPGGIYEGYSGPLFMVDKDLDFVMQVRDLIRSDTHVNQNGNYVVTNYRDEIVATYHVDDWVKIGLYSPYNYFNWGMEPLQRDESSDYQNAWLDKPEGWRTITGRGRVLTDEVNQEGSTGYFRPWPQGWITVYPNSVNLPIYKGGHLPDLSLHIVRQVAGISLGARNPGSRWPPRRRTRGRGGSWTRDTSSDNIDGLYSANRPPTNNEFPYGIPYYAVDENQYSPEAWDKINVGLKDTPGFKQGRLGLFTEMPKRSRWSDSSDFGFCVNTVLTSLPDEFERGFFNSVKWANEKFEGGAPLNKGLEKYITNDFIHLFTQGRRIAVNEIAGNTSHKPGLNNPVEDVTFEYLLTGRPGIGEGQISMADFSSQNIQSVAEIPIKREVVDNLLNRNNRNMSLLQFLKQILAPTSIGLNGNIHVGVRMDSNNVIEIIPASISYKGVADDMFKNGLAAEIEDDPTLNDYLKFDYKKRNSLIESIDMSSKMDPAAFLTYQNSSDLIGPGRDYNVLKLLSYAGVAEDFKEYLDNTPKVGDSGENYTGVISIGEDNVARVNKVAFNQIPSSIMDGAIAQNPERWARIIAMMQGQNNFTTELLAFYMRSVTLIIHGTTNIKPFNLINVTGVLPELEGIYIITNITERVTPTAFQTILEGKLLKRRRVVTGEAPVSI